MLPNRQKLLLCYTKKKHGRRFNDFNRIQLKGSRLVLLDYRNVQVSTFEVTSLCYDLDIFFGTLPVLSTEHGRFEVGYAGNKLSIQKLSYDLVNLKNEQIVDSVPHGMYYSTFHAFAPEFDYILHREKALFKDKFISSVSDSAQLYRWRACWRDLEGGERVAAMKQARAWGVEKEIAAGFLAGYHTSLYFRALHAPMFKLGDEFVLFNPYKDKIYYFDEEGEPLREQIFNFPMNRYGLVWSEIIVDPVSEKVYASMSYQTRTYLREIDLATGTVGEDMKLYHKNVEEVEIVDNEVFYIYRPFDSPQKKYLYSEIVKF